ncbi:MAG: ribose 5-phosphate isomerase B [Polyangiales bacterium]
MKIVAGADHGGFVLKNELVLYLREKGHEVEDLGTHSDTSVDYPDYGLAVARAVLENRAERGLLVCGTGVGIAIAANRHLGIRAVNCSDVFTARLSRSHNDSNVLSLGGRVVGIGLAKEILDAWLNQAFEGGRHQKRIDKLG